MTVSTLEIKGFDDFSKFIETINSNVPPVLFYFTGEKQDGKSWCSDCNEAEPIVKAFLSELKKNVIFVFVDVGNREYWKDKSCPFRTDPRTKLMVIPTIIKWKGVQRLEGSQCNKRDLLQMLFEDEED